MTEGIDDDLIEVDDKEENEKELVNNEDKKDDKSNEEKPKDETNNKKEAADGTLVQNVSRNVT